MFFVLMFFIINKYVVVLKKGLFFNLQLHHNKQLVLLNTFCNYAATAN
jgi:hypothetical protein